MFSLFGSMYGRLADLRNTFYDRGIFKTNPLGAKTISIGNITAGGTGKTPLVALIAEILADNGETVCILTRGYGRKNPKRRVLVSDGKNVLADAAMGGDEPVELARKLTGKSIIIADADRVSAAEWALDEFGVTVFVLDDGFQHRRARRDLDIVCVDATNPFGSGKMLPAGILREPLKNLQRAHVIVLTRANLAGDIENLKAQISDLKLGLPLFTAENRISDVNKLADFLAGISKPQSVETIPALAFCALGNPGNFFEQLRRDGFDIVTGKPLPDHHFYTLENIADLEETAGNAKAEILLTTAKDAVKLNGLTFTMPCFVIDIQLDIDDEKDFHRLITSF
ncbi:MAG: tetraacyldisaccharide 4'-kinase [Pyrinomonadaceae bacterium]